MKKILSIVLASAMLMTCLTACGGGTSSSTPGGSSSGDSSTVDYGKIPANLSIGTSPEGQAAYVMGAGIADVVNKANIGTYVTAEVTNGFPVNVQYMMNNEMEFGMINNFMLQQVYAASGSYSNYEAGKIMGVVSLGPAELHVIVPANSDIESIYDFAGKRIGVGQPGGVVLDVTTMFLEAIGYDDDDFTRLELNLANQCEYMQDGQLDAIMWIGNYPLAAVTNLTNTGNYKFLSIDDDAIAKMQAKCSVIEKATIPAGSYKGQDADVSTFCMRNMLAVHADVSNETVYQITKLIMENVSTLGAVHATMSSISKETATLGMTSDTPLHPGALRYYQEIGVAGLDALTAK